jgi:hypothetical protein
MERSGPACFSEQPSRGAQKESGSTTLRSTPAGSRGLAAARASMRRTRGRHRPGRARLETGYFLPMVTVADAVCETQPRFEASVTVRVVLPLLPTVKVT